MNLEKTLELHPSGVSCLIDRLNQRRSAYERFARRPRGGGYQARVLLESMRDIVQALSLTVPFRTGSYQLEEHLLSELGTLARCLLAVPIINLTIEGHTDVRGARRFNRKLALQRARAVRDALHRQGVAGDRLVARAVGVEGATYPNGDRGGYPFDRKATIKFEIPEVTT